MRRIVRFAWYPKRLRLVEVMAGGSEYRWFEYSLAARQWVFWTRYTAVQRWRAEWITIGHEMTGEAS